MIRGIALDGIAQENITYDQLRINMETKTVLIIFNFGNIDETLVDKIKTATDITFFIKEGQQIELLNVMYTETYLEDKETTDGIQMQVEIKCDTITLL